MKRINTTASILNEAAERCRLYKRPAELRPPSADAYGCTAIVDAVYTYRMHGPRTYYRFMRIDASQVRAQVLFAEAADKHGADREGIKWWPLRVRGKRIAALKDAALVAVSDPD